MSHFLSKLFLWVCDKVLMVSLGYSYIFLFEKLGFSCNCWQTFLSFCRESWRAPAFQDSAARSHCFSPLENQMTKSQAQEHLKFSILTISEYWWDYSDVAKIIAAVWRVGLVLTGEEVSKWWSVRKAEQVRGQIPSLRSWRRGLETRRTWGLSSNWTVSGPSGSCWVLFFIFK